MAHYAKVCDGIVVKVIVAEADYFENFVDDSPGEYIQTSYNTKGGKHWDPESNFTVESEDQSKALRKNFASVGDIYDGDRDAFISPQPYASWTLNEDTCLWEAPQEYPEIPLDPETGELLGHYSWNEDNYNDADLNDGWEWFPIDTREK